MSMMSNVQAAKLLGWTSLAVGATEIVATRQLEEVMGVGEHRTLIRAFGVREIAAGVSILSQPGPNKSLAFALWARVAGDAADLALLSIATKTTDNPRGLGAIMAIVLAVTGLDVAVASRIQGQLAHVKKVSEAARRRVTPTSATPNGATRVEPQMRAAIASAN